MHLSKESNAFWRVPKHRENYRNPVQGSKNQSSSKHFNKESNAFGRVPKHMENYRNPVQGSKFNLLVSTCIRKAMLFGGCPNTGKTIGIQSNFPNSIF